MTMGASRPSTNDLSRNSHLPARTTQKASFLPSCDRVSSNADIPGEVSACPLPVIRPAFASKGKI
jgi:hypothetical protein